MYYRNFAEDLIPQFQTNFKLKLPLLDFLETREAVELQFYVPHVYKIMDNIANYHNYRYVLKPSFKVLQLQVRIFFGIQQLKYKTRKKIKAERSCLLCTRIRTRLFTPLLPPSSKISGNNTTNPFPAKWIELLITGECCLHL